MTAEVVPMQASGVAIDREAVLRHLNLNPRDAGTQALLLVCDRYGLDPLLKHMVLIQGRPYVTRDGYLHLAHQSGQLDGIEVLEEGDDGDHWWARVSVFRKDMSRAFTYKGRYPKSGGNKTYGPEMAIKCAEVASLRRAFNVTGIGAADEKWDADDEHTVDPVVVDPEPSGPTVEQDALAAFFEALKLEPEDVQVEMRSWWAGFDKSLTPSEALLAGQEYLDAIKSEPEPPTNGEAVDEAIAEVGMCLGCGKKINKTGQHAESEEHPGYGLTCIPF